ncbi:serine hydrolase [Aquimarina sp. 2201CG5-10]|uniref:serine hydrolase domain-containing protein n=1 Tax=Aquimarina callyspongiae TaxID=3098150 RepID=UPI002AB4BD20|nr:serine hydrolase [Aquimarina sp. 2201CG5-10]MDY8135284.1 serine hydrolase [Aquimarina sp. 2201CG5-10]
MKRFKKILRYVFMSLIMIILIAVFLNYPKLTILTGYSAKNMCSSVFMANRSIEFTDVNDNNFAPVHLADDEVDIKEKSAIASVFGLQERKAIYREGLGSVLINDDFDTSEPYLKPNRSTVKKNFPFPYGDLPQKDTVFENVDYNKINGVVSSIFDTKGESIKKTRAVMVIHKDQIIAEKYTDGLNKDSKLLGWSMTKSILATVYGVLQHQGKIDINDKAPVSEWQKDERKNITINNLLQMNCGLAWDEDYNSISDATKMLYIDEDMTKTQVYKEATHKPNEYWYYSSGVSNLLSGILREHFDSYQEYLDYPYREFIDKIGMHSMLIETDMVGNYVGSSYGWASVKDWAKFGLLYLHRGNWNGEQVFNPEWVDYVTTPSPTSDGDYGGHFWLNSGGFYPDAPRDMYSANGYQGQRVFIIPSKNLVIVRFGLIGDAGVDFNKFLKEIVSAIE